MIHDVKPKRRMCRGANTPPYISPEEPLNCSEQQSSATTPAEGGELHSISAAERKGGTQVLTTSAREMAEPGQNMASTVLLMPDSGPRGIHFIARRSSLPSEQQSSAGNTLYFYSPYPAEPQPPPRGKHLILFFTLVEYSEQQSSATAPAEGGKHHSISAAEREGGKQVSTISACKMAKPG